MKKSLISLAVATGLMAAGAAQAAPTAYGFMDLSLVSPENGDLGLVSTTSAIGLKGSEDLGDGMKAIYKVELQVNIVDRCNSDDTTVTANDAVADGGNGDGVVDVSELATSSSGCDAIVDRDQFVGLKGGMGTVKIGTMSNNWKQMGSKIDPFYRTPLQMRSNGQQSRLHKGAGLNGGRSTYTVQYASPKMGGMQMVANTTFSGVNDANTSGVGFRYSSKMVTAWVDFLSVGNTGGNGAAADESGTKIGAVIKATKALKIGLQLEQIEDLVPGAGNVSSLSATFAVNKANTIAFTWGSSENERSGYNLGLWHKMSKKTSLYVAYNDTTDENSADSKNYDGSTFALGIRKKF